MLLLLLALACSNQVPDPAAPDPTAVEPEEPTAQVDPAAEPTTQAEPTAHNEPAPEPLAPVDPKTDLDPAEPDPSAAPDDFETCMARCERANMARPVAPELITDDCIRICAAEHEVRSKADLELRLGQRIRVTGAYERQLHHGHGPEPYMGTAIVLEDGALLWISTGDPPMLWEALLDKKVRVEGLFTTGEENDPGMWLVKLGLPQPVDPP
jgi:hypothetical protein